MGRVARRPAQFQPRPDLDQDRLQLLVHFQTRGHRNDLILNRTQAALTEGSPSTNPLNLV